MHVQRNSVARSLQGKGNSVFCVHIISLSGKWQDFRKTLLRMKCVLISSTSTVLTVSHSKKIKRYIFTNLHWSSCKLPAILSHFNKT
jgi:exoribonuclease R